jgi:signal transduction histidine kinase
MKEGLQMISKGRVLIVDDEAGVRRPLEIMLAYNGYQVKVADSGETALECIMAQRFDLALIDLKMNGIGGIEVLSALRQQSPDTVSIVLTAHGSMETAVEALRQGAHDYLFKPCKMNEILESVRTGLLRKRQEMEMRTQFEYASDVSHELRNPITSIGLYLKLSEHCQPEERAQYLDLLKQETTYMANLVESILSLSRLKAGTFEVEFAPEDLNAVVAQAITAQYAHAEAVGLGLIFEPGPDLPPVCAERYQLIQVVKNLVTNAINYTPSGQVRVSTYLDVERGQACLQVQDTGIGIEPDDLPHLFKRFYRGTRDKHSDIPGTGLGLAIVKEIVDAHGGDIEVESQVDEGSTFKVWLPLENHIWAGGDGL